MRIWYGVQNNYTDVTRKCWKKMTVDGRLRIPTNDVARARYLGDPIPNVLKHIKIGDKIYSDQEEIDIDITYEEISTDWRLDASGNYIESPQERLEQLHQEIDLFFGSLRDEYPEQLMAMTYLSPEDIVLEIGGNIGRNSCVIGNILHNSNQLTVLESSPEIAKALTINRDQNGLNFKIISCALSKQPLIQSGWVTRPLVEEHIPQGWNFVRTVTYSDIVPADMKFNVLVLDCEGAMEYILQDFPEILEGIDKIIIENDFNNLEAAKTVHEKFRESGLSPVYTEAGGWGPCEEFFFQVWLKN